MLFIAEAVTLAHVARVHAVAGALDPSRYEVCIAADPRFDALFGAHPFASQRVTTIPAARFAAAIQKGTPIYDVTTLAGYVDDDLRAIASFEPDVVVGDFRLSLSVSARLAGTPYVTITNAGWSPYAKIGFTVPDLPMTRWLGVTAAQALFDWARPFAFAAHARPVNRLRQRYGMARLASDVRAVYTDADFILYADLPEMFSMQAMPKSHAFLGPVQWSPDTALPDWWDVLPDDRPLIYVTLGSSGQSQVLPALVDALSRLPLSVMVATAGRIAMDAVPDNVHMADYLPGATAAQRADLVISNGGSPTSYQAFAAGTPVLGIPTNLDQFLNMRAVCGSGAGLLMRPASVADASIARAVDALLHEPAFRENAGVL
ncbi:MAG: nucleotide disphospho-sugar-binding domain-containing protein, partial [Burkholderiaceae bacterium]